jgi:hypothetical protein
VGQPDYQKAAPHEPQPPQEFQPRQLHQGGLITEATPEVETGFQTPASPQVTLRARGVGASSRTAGDAREDSDAPEEGWGADYDLPTEE